MSKGNAVDFASLIQNYDESYIYCYKDMSEDQVIIDSHAVARFSTDYRRPIEHYYKACGCKILGTNNNWWNDRFYVYHTKPNKAVDAVQWFNEQYKDGVYMSNNKVALLWVVSVGLLLMLLITIVRFNFG